MLLVITIDNEKDDGNCHGDDRDLNDDHPQAAESGDEEDEEEEADDSE